APMWVNSLMMTDGERPAAWIGLTQENTQVTGEVLFNLIPDTHIVDYGLMQFTFTEGNRSVALKKQLEPWKNVASYPRVTDTAQNTLVAFNLLKNNPPA